MNIQEILSISPIIPVAVIPPEVDAVALAQALHAGGISVIEVVLRTPNAIDAIAAISDGVADVCVGAGTVWTADEAVRVIDAGAKFIVSPAFVREVFDICEKRDIPYLPGVSTVTEAANCAALGMSAVKVFPANIVGGPGAVKAFASVLPQLAYCPTGGVNLESAPAYLALENVKCVGGSWLLDKKALQQADWQEIQNIARQSLEQLKKIS